MCVYIKLLFFCMCRHYNISPLTASTYMVSSPRKYDPFSCDRMNERLSITYHNPTLKEGFMFLRPLMCCLRWQNKSIEIHFKCTNVLHIGISNILEPLQMRE